MKESGKNLTSYLLKRMRPSSLLPGQKSESVFIWGFISIWSWKNNVGWYHKCWLIYCIWMLVVKTINNHKESMTNRSWEAKRPHQKINDKTKKNFPNCSSFSPSFLNTNMEAFYRSLSDKGKKVPALKNVELICTIPCRSLLTPSYYHSFGITDNYIVFIEQPFKLDILKMATAYMRGVNWASCMKFSPDENVRSHFGYLFCLFLYFLSATQQRKKKANLCYTW